MTFNRSKGWTVLVIDFPCINNPLAEVEHPTGNTTNSGSTIYGSADGK